MKHCSSCGREVRESLTLCEQCERWAADSVVGPVPDLPSLDVEATPAPVVERPTAIEPLRAVGPRAVEPLRAVEPPRAVEPLRAVDPPRAPEPLHAAPPASTSAVLSRRGLLAIVGAVVVGGLVTFAILSARGPSADVAAARVVAPARKASPPASPPSATTTMSQKWSSENRAYWVGNEKKAAAFELPAEQLVPIWLNRVRPLLVVRCVAKSTEVFVWTGSAIAMEAQTEDHTVTYRIDDEPEITERWPDSAEHDALFTRDGTAFARRLIAARAMRIGYTPHNAASVVADFNVSGLGPLVEAFAKECGWPSPAKVTASLPKR